LKIESVAEAFPINKFFTESISNEVSTMNGYEALARILQIEGVEFLSAFPAQPLIEACAHIGIRPIICRQERTGVNIADGFSRISNGRRFGVFSMQQGPGAENCFAGVAQAYADSVPMLILAGGEPLSRQGVSPTFEARRNFQYVTKWAAQINKVEDIPHMLRRASIQMKQGHPGPVMLEMPGDVMGLDYPGNVEEYKIVRRRESLASKEDVRELITALLKASSPVIVAGQGVLYSQATAELVAFAELAQLPVMTTLAGKSAFPENHPLALGTGGLSRTLMVRRFLESTDFSMGVGTSFTRNTFTTPMPEGIVLAQVSNCAEDIGKDYEVEFGAVGEIRLALQQMIEEYQRQDGPKVRGDGQGVANRVASVRDEFDAEWESRHASDEIPINPYRVFRELANSFDPANTIITHDSGYPRDQLLPMWKPVSPRGYIGWGKSTQLGYGLGLSIGAKLAAPEKQVINIMGDAAFGMSGLDLETAVRSEIPILTVVLNNSVMTNYDHHLPEATKRYRSNELGGNYSKIAEGLGVHSERVATPGGLAPAFKRAEAANREGRPALVEAISKVEKNVSK
jgi:acetolactate synthase-1/2/3 large subunit